MTYITFEYIKRILTGQYETAFELADPMQYFKILRVKTNMMPKKPINSE